MLSAKRTLRGKPSYVVGFTPTGEADHSPRFSAKIPLEEGKSTPD